MVKQRTTLSKSLIPSPRLNDSSLLTPRLSSSLDLKSNSSGRKSSGSFVFAFDENMNIGTEDFKIDVVDVDLINN